MDLEINQIEDRILAIHDKLNFGYPSNVLASILKLELESLAKVIENNAVQEMNDDDE